MATTKNVNTIGLQISKALRRTGENIGQSAFNVTRQEFTSSQMKTFLSQFFNFSKVQLTFSDAKYYLTDWKKWQEFIEYSWIDEMTYWWDWWDCDDFANLFKAEAGKMLKCNSAIYAWGKTIWPEGTIGAHAFTLIPTIDNGQLNLYCYEPMSDEFVKMEVGQPIKMPPTNREYQPLGMRM